MRVVFLGSRISDTHFPLRLRIPRKVACLRLVCCPPGDLSVLGDGKEESLEEGTTCKTGGEGEEEEEGSILGVVLGGGGGGLVGLVSISMEYISYIVSIGGLTKRKLGEWTFNIYICVCMMSEF